MEYNYSVLIENEFFQRINGMGKSPFETAYTSFATQVINLCHTNNNPKYSMVALIYSEIELQFHRSRSISTLHPKDETALYINKALILVKKMQRYLINTVQILSPILPASSVEKLQGNEESPILQWTGNILDLVELIYGLYEMGCINKGETPLNIIAPTLYLFFGVDTQEYYRYYSAIKQRKNESRTYFLDKMQEKLNEKMRRDDERERMRK